MNYKSILLAGLFLPACCLGNPLEQLKEKQSQLLREGIGVYVSIFPNKECIDKIYQEYKKQLAALFKEKRKEMPGATDQEIEELVFKNHAALYNEFLAIPKGESSHKYCLLDTFLNSFSTRFFNTTDKAVLDRLYKIKTRKSNGLLEEIGMEFAKDYLRELVQELINTYNDITKIEQKYNHEIHDIIAIALLTMPPYTGDQLGVKEAEAFNKSVEEAILSTSKKIEEWIDETAESIEETINEYFESE